MREGRQPGGRTGSLRGSEMEKKILVLPLVSCLTDPQFCHLQSPTGQWWKETSPPLIIGKPGFYPMSISKSLFSALSTLASVATPATG